MMEAAKLDDILSRTIKPADLMRALADQTTTAPVRSGALQVAADYAEETADKLSVMLDRDE